LPEIKQIREKNTPPLFFGFLRVRGFSLTLKNLKMEANMSTTRNFSTLDIYLSAFLSLHNHEPTLEIINGKIVFTFETINSLYQTMNCYNADEQVPVATYTTHIKTLRGKMLTAKEGMNWKRNGHGEKKTEI
jgi:hypothetical protein